MRDGKALQMGTSHNLGPELRAGVRHPFLHRQASSVHALDDVVGGVDPAVGGAGHGPRRRPRAGAPAGARPDPGVVVWRQGREAARSGGPTRPPRSGRAGCGCAPDDRTDISFGRRATEWELEACRCASRWVPATSPKRETTAWCCRDRRTRESAVRRSRGIAERVDETAAVAATQHALLERGQGRSSAIGPVRPAATIEAAADCRAVTAPPATAAGPRCGPDGERRLDRSRRLRPLRYDALTGRSADEPRRPRGLVAIAARAY